MKNFPSADAFAASGAARLSRLDAANALVRRTLAQHGLMPDAGDGRLSGRAASASAGPRTGGLVIPDGARFVSATFSGRSGSRAYRTYVPSTAGDGVTSVVMMLHGCTQTPEDFALGTGMNTHAEAHRFVVLYPEQSRGANAQTCWNWFSSGDQRRDRGEPEILAGIARKAAADHGISRDRTFVAGLSAGAAMAAILGETHPDVFAAIGVHSGLPRGAASDVPSAFAAMAGNGSSALDMPSRSDLRTIIFHGDADHTVHPSNAAAVARQADARGAAVTHQRDETLVVGGRTVRRTVTIDTYGGVQM